MKKKVLSELTEEEFEDIKKAVHVENLIRETPLDVLFSWRKIDPGKRKFTYSMQDSIIDKTIKWVCVLVIERNGKREKFLVLKQGKIEDSSLIKRECLEETALECIRHCSLLNGLENEIFIKDVIVRDKKRKRMERTVFRNKKAKFLDKYSIESSDDETDFYEEGYTGRKLTEEEKEILDEELDEYMNSRENGMVLDGVCTISSELGSLEYRPLELRPLELESLSEDEEDLLENIKKLEISR